MHEHFLSSMKLESKQKRQCEMPDDELNEIQKVYFYQRLKKKTIQKTIKLNS